MADNTQAIDDMVTLLLSALGAGSPGATLLTYVPDLRYDGKEKSTLPDPAKLWARLSHQGVRDGQTSMAAQVSGPDKRRYRVEGLLFVQIFAPMVDGGMDILEKVANIVKNSYRGKISNVAGVIFRNVRINDLPNDGKSYRKNVVAETSYDEIV